MITKYASDTASTHSRPVLYAGTRFVRERNAKLKGRGFEDRMEGADGRTRADPMGSNRSTSRTFSGSIELLRRRPFLSADAEAVRGKVSVAMAELGIVGSSSAHRIRFADLGTCFFMTESTARFELEGQPKDKVDALIQFAKKTGWVVTVDNAVHAGKHVEILANGRRILANDLP